jgi:hypothetical protein
MTCSLTPEKQRLLLVARLGAGSTGLQSAEHAGNSHEGRLDNIDAKYTSSLHQLYSCAEVITQPASMELMVSVHINHQLNQ